MAAISSIILGAAAIAGAATSVYSASAQSQAASDAAEQNNQILAAQQKQEELRQQAMELDARRKQMELFRNQQRARATALSTSVSQGASYGSGLYGAYGQISGQYGANVTAIDQQLQFGVQNFDINSQITGYRQSLADTQAYASNAVGIGSLGGSLVNTATTFSKLGQGFSWGSSNNNYSTNYNPYYGTGSSSGYIY